ncbi:phytanoyl-CoA dioxygenase family protein [Paenibacillus sp. strain BS8-2]
MTNNQNELSLDYTLTEDQIQKFGEDGHIFLTNLVSQPAIQEFENHITDWVMKLNYQNKPVSERDTYGKAFIQIGNVWTKSEEVRKFVTARRFAKIAADLMGVDSVRIYHDQALFKEPGGGHTPWHQDQIYWPLDTNNTITMWMPLVPISAEVGTMNFASGTHKLGYVSRQEISDESHRTLGQFIEARGIQQVNYGAMAAGDATFHAGWTIHSAPGNPTDHMRKVMTVIYYADGERISKPASKAQEHDMEQWFPGLRAGDLAASHLNPLVYTRK